MILSQRVITPELKIWYRARYLILYCRDDHMDMFWKGVDLAKSVADKNEDAAYFIQTIGNDCNISTTADARRLFWNDDIRNYVYAYVIGKLPLNYTNGRGDLGFALHKAADHGDSLAQSICSASIRKSAEIGYHYAVLSVKQDDPEGLLSLSGNYQSMITKSERLLCIRRAMDFEHPVGVFKRALFFDRTEAERYKTLNKCFDIVLCHIFLFTSEYILGTRIECPLVLYQIGKGTRKYLKDNKLFHEVIQPDAANAIRSAIILYTEQNRLTKAAAKAFTLIIHRRYRYQVNHDIRKMICSMIWESRDEALYY